MELTASTTALVLIDLQKGVLAMPVKPYPATAVYQGSMRFAERFRAAGAAVIRVRVSFAPDFADAPRPKVDQPTNYDSMPRGWDEFPEPPAATDIVVTKRNWGAFYGTDLDLQLRRRGVRTIVLAGISTSIGVESTARAAVEHGYEIVVAEDLCSAASAEHHTFSITQILTRLARVSSSGNIALA
jgi:nicotinamidase-related amidase